MQKRQAVRQPQKMHRWRLAANLLTVATVLRRRLHYIGPNAPQTMRSIKQNIVLQFRNWLQGAQ